MSIAKEYELLSRLDIFEKLDSTQLKRLLFASERYQVVAGEYLFKQGDTADNVFVILEGELSVLLESPQGEVEIAVRISGDLIGELASITGESRVASIRAKNDCEVIGIESKLFLDTVTNDPPTALKIMQLLSSRLIEISRARTSTITNQL